MLKETQMDLWCARIGLVVHGRVHPEQVTLCVYTHLCLPSLDRGCHLHEHSMIPVDPLRPN